MRYTIESITAPTYAADGSKGYQITVGWSGLFRNTDGVHTESGVMPGWVDRTADQRVIATIDHHAWEYVTSEPVPDEAWSETWVSGHAAAIIGIYGWQVTA